MFQKLPKFVKIVEVGPRDGLQNESQILSAETKLKYIQMLLQAGARWIEATSFVRADRIPQMGDASGLFKQVLKLKESKGAHLFVLVPNLKGLENALQAGANSLAVFTATSEKFNQKNINASIADSLKQIREVVKEARAHNSKVEIRAYVSTVFGCPYEGKTSVDTLKSVVAELQALKVDEISLGDTIGVANPLQVQSILRELSQGADKSKLAMHFHDTRGLALANVLASLEEGIQTFDASSGGLGGCPYAKGATGNLATEDLLYMLQSMGISTDLDMPKLIQASTYILKELKKETGSKYLASVLRTSGTA